MHIHILGICGTFMGGIAAIARAAGHTVTGSDQNVYPPMSDQLRSLGIELIEGFDSAQLDLNPDVVVVGNVMSRGMPLVEEMLNRDVPYTSGPAWLAENVLRDRHVIAVSGTHGKTTTASMVAWLLEHAGLQPGFLIGGVPANFEVTARLGEGKFFVIEADEYDTTFFDKRAKFLHYGPDTLVINNLEFDHADIYQDLDAILWQFHQMLRILPGNGQVIVNATDQATDRLLKMGCWTEVKRFSSDEAAGADLQVNCRDGRLCFSSCEFGDVATELVLPGLHNAENAAGAVMAAGHAGISLASAAAGLSEFRGVKRRLELRARVNGVSVYDDFAHHPTAIRRTLDAVAETSGGRVLAVVEPRSNSMKLGVHREGLAASLQPADFSWLLQPEALPWDLAGQLAGNEAAAVCNDVDSIVGQVCAYARPGDDIVVMSNGGFGGIHTRLSAALEGLHQTV